MIEPLHSLHFLQKIPRFIKYFFVGNRPGNTCNGYGGEKKISCLKADRNVYHCFI